MNIVTGLQCISDTSIIRWEMYYIRPHTLCRENNAKIRAIFCIFILCTVLSALIVCLESGSPLPMPPDVPLPNFDGGKSSQDSVLSESESGDPATPHKVPLVDLAGSPTSKRRQPSSVSSRHVPRQPDRTPGSRPGGSPVWMPNSAPTKLANGYRHRGDSPSKSLEMELSASVQPNRPAVYNGQIAHSRVAALQSQGRTPVYTVCKKRHPFIFAITSSGVGHFS